jgi:hypothetical protein
MLKTPEDVHEPFWTVIEPSGFVHIADRLAATDGSAETCTGPFAAQ